MRVELAFICFLVLIIVSGCSMPPEKPVTRQELYKTNIFSEFAIKDSPQSVLATLNRDGEAVLEGRSRYGEEFYIKILATNTGLKIRLYAK